MKPRIIVGIDPGAKTGFAVWNCDEQMLTVVKTYNIIQAFQHLSNFRPAEIWFEDARLRTWFGKTDRERLQGVGSVKRDCAIWQTYCEFHGIPFKAIKPGAGQSKWGADYFKRVTGWEKRTSEHARDAACLVFGVR